jgi:SAM-dependent methyltransferase
VTDYRSRLPGGLKALARPLVWRISDAVTSVRGELLPPRRLVSQVPGDFRKVGREFLSHFTTLAGFRPDQRVIDIGCGPGRMAIPLTGYMSAEGRYEGADTWSEAVEWCASRITPGFANFRFTSLDGGSGIPEFPFADGEFDFAIVCSISRLDEKTFRKYVLEAGRLLRQGGIYFGTCFVSVDPADDPGTRPQTAMTGAAEPPFVFSQDQIEAVLGSAGLRIEQLHRGSWAGHPAPLSYQDVIVAVRT